MTQHSGNTFSKLARITLFEIKVKSIDELENRIDQYFQEINKSLLSSDGNIKWMRYNSI